MSGTVKGIIVEIGGDTSGLQKALSKINSASSSLSKELRGINSLLKLDPSNTILVAQKQKVLAENISTTEEKLKSLKEAQEEADNIIAKGGEINKENYRSLQREIIATQNKLSALKVEASNWTKAGDVLIKYGERLTAISKKVETLGTNLTTKITLPLVALAGVSVNSAMEFETAFTGVEKTVDGTAEQLEELKKGIKDMSEELPSSTTEIAAVAEAAGQLGIQTDNILGFSKAMIDLGNSTNLTADEAASQLAKFANIMQMSQKDFDKLGSSIVDLGNNFATTEADIVEMSMRIAGAGKQVGLSEGQVLGLATALSSVGIEAEMGGSAISKAMVKMQSAVEVGGDKLNDTLNKTGKSLRDLELMSANDSKGFKELSQSIGLTSTELKQMITAGTSLEDFAKISGMSAEEFKKAWKDDAAGALSAFIKGLGDAESKGDSAITMLTEMGLTEVRLRDSLLRAANAGDLFNNAIETGTKAWDENTALTNEANKRYETLASQVQITKNKLSNLATNIGNKMTPTASKMLDKVNDLIDSFDDLTEEETVNIIKTATFVAGIGPALTILGKLGTKLGTTATTLGNFSKAIANVKNGVKTAEGQVGTFTTILSNLPVTIAAISIGALTVALLELTTREEEVSEELKETRNSLDEQMSSWENLKQAREKYISENSSEITELQHLKEELSKITDENGSIKKGYEDRANFIVGKLKEATGKEIEINDGVIQSYEEIQKAIDDTLRKKEAELLLSAYQTEYTEALQNRSTAVQNLATLQGELTKKLEKQKEIEDKLSNQKIPSADLLESYSRVSEEIENLNTDIVNCSELISENGYVISNYANLEAATISGSSEAIQEALQNINTEYDKTKEKAEQSYTEQVNSTGKYVSTLKTLLQDAKNTGDKYRTTEIQNEIDAQRTKLKNLEESLKNEVYTIGTIGEEQIQAFKYIADNDRNGYMEILKNLDPDTQALLQDITNSVSSNMQIPEEFKNKAQASRQNYNEEINNISTSTDTELKATAATVNNYNGIEIAAGNKGVEATTSFDNNNNISQKMQEEVNATANVENSDISIGGGASRLANEANTNFNNNVNGHKWGSDLTENISSGIISKIASVASAAARVAGTIASYLHHSVPDKGPLSDELEYMPDMIDNLVKTLYKSSPKLENATLDLAEKMASNLDLSKYQSALNAKVIDSTKTVFTTPQIVFNVQELDEAKLKQCFNYINEKFGSKYPL